MNLSTSASIHFHQRVLHAQFQARKAKNKRFSLRNFARSVGMDPSAMSRILAGKMDFTPGIANLLMKALDLSEADKTCFLVSVAQERKLRLLNTLAVGASVPLSSENRADLTADAFVRMHHVHRHAVAGSLYLENTQIEDPRWIAERLGISMEETREALAFLINRGILRRDGTTLVQGGAALDTINPDCTPTMRTELEQQALEVARAALASVPPERRESDFTVMAINPELFPLAHLLTQNFLDDLSILLETGANREPYRVSVQIVPLHERPPESTAS